MRVSHTNVYGLGRAALALGTLSTLLFASGDTLFTTNGFRVAPTPFDEQLLFGLSREHLWVARASASFVLMLVIVGWRPRITGLLHWWVSFSFVQQCAVPDGGDQITAVLTLLLVPVTLTDPRANHWHAPPNIDGPMRVIGNEVAWSALQVTRVQVAFIYAFSAIAKLGVPEWANGTAMFYWAQDPSMGLPKAVHAWAMPILLNPFGVVALSWTPIALMLVLALSLSMESQIRKWLVWPAVVFHAGNMVIFGLVSFFLAMSAADVLLLVPLQIPLVFRPPAWTTAFVQKFVKRRQYESATC